MKNRKLFLIIGIQLVAGGPILAAPVPNEVPAMAENEEGSEEIRIEPKHILEIGDKNDRTKIADLRRIKARDEKMQGVRAENAQMALAKMGEKKEMDEIIEESRSEDNSRRSAGIRKLGYVGNKLAVKRLVELLDDMESKRDIAKGRDGKLRRSDVKYDPPALNALRALKKIFPDGPNFKLKHPSKADIAPWKEWWKTNKQKYQ